MYCRKTGDECKTESMCAPFGGCSSQEGIELVNLRKRIERLETAVLELNPGLNWALTSAQSQEEQK